MKIANYNFMKNRPLLFNFCRTTSRAFVARSSAAMGALSVPGASVRVSAIFVALSQILPIVANVATAHVELCAINCLYSEVGTREKVLNVRSAQEKKDASQL